MTGEFSALQTGKASIGFKSNMWLFGDHSDWDFSVVFTLLDVTEQLFVKAKEGLRQLVRL